MKQNIPNSDVCPLELGPNIHIHTEPTDGLTHELYPLDIGSHIHAFPIK